MADAIGLVVLAGLYLITLFLVPLPSAPTLLWFFVFFALAAAALYCWWHKKSPSTPHGWLLLSLGSLIFGAILFGADMILGSYQYPDISAVEAATRVGGPFGLLATIAICPGFTMIALAGSVRSLFWARF